MVYAIKAEIRDAAVSRLDFLRAKTMYGGKHIAVGDKLFLFASEQEGGRGLCARGVVAAVEAIAKSEAGARETPRVSLGVTRLTRNTRALGREQLKRFTSWEDGGPETELNFKFYRQATNKIVGISDETARFLDGFF